MKMKSENEKLLQDKAATCWQHYIYIYIYIYKTGICNMLGIGLANQLKYKLCYYGKLHGTRNLCFACVY